MRPAFRVLRARCLSTSTALFDEHLALMAAKKKEIFSKSLPVSMNEDDALLIIDVQKDFVPRSSSNPLGGAFGVSEGDAILPLVTSLIATAADASATIVATRDYHPHDHVSFENNGGAFPPHCVQGSEGAKFMPTVAAALADARGRLGPERVHVAFKGEEEDSNPPHLSLHGSSNEGCSLLTVARSNPAFAGFHEEVSGITSWPLQPHGDRGVFFSSSPSCAALTGLPP